jgi:hypothetical protein
MSDAPERIYIDRGPRGGWMRRFERMPDTEYEYIRTDTIPSLDAVLDAALEAAAYLCEEKARKNPQSQGQYMNAAHSINRIAADPEARAAILKAAEGRT